MSKKKCRKYDKEFKLNAVNLYLQKNRSLSQLSQELNVPVGALGGWVDSHRKSGEQAFPGKGHLKPEDERMKKLERELDVVRRERDILKKALAIFSLP